MAKRYTLQQVGRDVDELKHEWREELKPALAELHDFMVVQQDREVRHTVKSTGKVDWGRLMNQALIVLGIALTIILTIVQVLDKVLSK